MMFMHMRSMLLHVICLLILFGYIEEPFLVNRTGDARERGVVRVRLHII
jgi:hypothetical protein